MTKLSTILIWVVVIGVAFAILWWQGQLKRINAFIAETRDELFKCQWPSWDELKGSTVVVTLTIAVLGLFTVAVDYILNLVFFHVL